MSETQLDVGTVPAARSLAAVLRRQLDAGEPMRLLVGIYGQALAGTDPDRFSHVNVVLGGATIKVPKLAGLSTVPNAAAYVLATKDFLIAIGSVGASQAAGMGVPVGGIIPFGGTVAPGGFLLCNGQSVSKTDYALLYSVIGGTYGESGGNFNVPDLRRRTPFGSGSGYALGASDGQSEGGRGPWHHHSFSGNTSNAGAHQHGAVGDHQHLNRADGTPSVAQGATPTGASGTARNTTQNEQYYTAAAGGHSHPGVGDHSHSVSGGTSGGGADDAPGHVAVNYVIRAL